MKWYLSLTWHDNNGSLRVHILLQPERAPRIKRSLIRHDPCNIYRLSLVIRVCLRDGRVDARLTELRAKQVRAHLVKIINRKSIPERLVRRARRLIVSEFVATLVQPLAVCNI